MKKQQVLSRWKYIIIYDDSKKELTKYELDDTERLKNKMKRLKKRSLIGFKQTEINPPKINPSPKKFEITNQFVFSYNQEMPNFSIMPPFTIPLSEAKICHTYDKLPTLTSVIKSNQDNSETEENKQQILEKTKA